MVFEFCNVYKLVLVIGGDYVILVNDSCDKGDCCVGWCYDFI